jgi:hypothetical protein
MPSSGRRCPPEWRFKSDRLLEPPATTTAQVKPWRVPRLNELAVIGEAAAHLSDATCAMANEVPWKEIVGFRHVAVHAYFSVDWRIIHVTLKDDLPSFEAAVTPLLERI